MTHPSQSFPSRTIGIDLGDRSSRLCIRGADGEIVKERSLTTSPEAFTEFFKTEKGTRVAYEAGGQSPWVTWLLQSLGCETIVANSRQLQIIAMSHRKTDRRDAQLLSELAHFRPGLLSPITHQTKAAHGHRAVITARDTLVSTRTSIINSIRGLAKSMGHRLPSSRSDAFHTKVEESIPEELRAAVDPLLGILKQVTNEIREFELEIKRIGAEDHPVTTLLRQIAGVGPITSLAFVLRIEDPKRFKRSREVGAYLGLVPRSQQSGESDPKLRITKAGDPHLRMLLVQCAHYIMGPFGGECDLRRFGERLLGRAGAHTKKQVVVAVARKLAVLLHRLWLTGEVYDPDYQLKRRKHTAHDRTEAGTEVA